jgi:serine/threonine protein kinase
LYRRRYIEAENVLVTDDGMSCKLTDFGFAVNYRQHNTVTRLGTVGYMAGSCTTFESSLNP